MFSEIVLMVCALVGCVADAQPLGTFSLMERFGVGHPEQPVEFSYTRGPVGAARLVGPDGMEVPFQQLSNGNILIRTGLPASRIPRTYVAELNPHNDVVTINLNLLQFAQPLPGEVIRFVAPAPAGLTAGVDYYLKPQADRFRYQLSTQRNLADTVNFTASGEATVVRPGWTIDRAAGALYAPAHGYSSGQPVFVTSTGTLPAPLDASTLYYAIRASTDFIRLAATRADAMAGRPITLQSSGSGSFGTEVRWTWRLEPGSARTMPAQPVRLTAAAGAHELTNGLTGVRVATKAANPAPFRRAPIQGIRLANGLWAATGPNLLYDAYSQRLATSLSGYEVRVLENGPLLTRLEASYTTNRPEYSYGGYPLNAADPARDEIAMSGNFSHWGNGRMSISFRANGGTLPCGLEEKRLYWPQSRRYDSIANLTWVTLATAVSGPLVNVTCEMKGRPVVVETWNLPGRGVFRETISLYAGQKSVVIESDTDTSLQYFLNFLVPGQFLPNKARIRAHAVSRQACGYSLLNGARSNYIPYTDGIVDLPATANSSYQCSADLLRFAPVWNLASSGIDSGWYWQLYQDGAAATAPTVGYVLGRHSRLLTAINSGPGVYTGANHFASGGRAAGVTFFAGFRGADGASAQRTRREWMIYTGSVGEMRNFSEIQPVAIERNALAYINLTKLASYVLDYGDPAGGWPAPFMDQSDFQQMVTRVQTDSAYRNSLNAAAPELRDLIRFWQNHTAQGAEVVVSNIEQFIEHWRQIMVNRDGGFENRWSHNQATLVWQPLASRVLAILSSSAATSSQKRRVKAAAAFVAHVLWDNDFVPADADAGDGFGTANQAVQYSMYRAQSALMLGAAHPVLSSRRELSRQAVESTLRYLHPVSGAPRGSTWYHGAAMDPALANFLLLKANGLDMNQYPVWKKYGNWMLDALTPPEPRFGNVRKMVSSGDGNTGASPMQGMVASLLRDADPAASAALQWGWQAQNSALFKTYSQFSAPSVLVIDEAAPARAPAMRSANYEGYWSVLRHGFETPNETAAWFTNGGFYDDHRHTDTGQVSIYAHAAPLAIDWNANLYNPQTAGALQHNRIVLEDNLPLRWNADSLPLNIGGNPFPTAGPTSFVAQEFATSARTPFSDPANGQWQRSVTLVAADARYPALLVRDQFSGARAAASKILTWNLMAQGTVTAPGGGYPPIERVNLSPVGGAQTLPSSGLVLDLPAGPQRFQFRGQDWAAHPTRGIDWDLYLVPEGPQSFYIGNWGHSAHPTREIVDYQRANGTSFREQQHILRVRGNAGFTTLILPHRKGETPAQRTVRQEACGLRVTQTGLNLCIGEHGYEYAGSQRQVVASFGAQPVNGLGVQIAGGPVEVVMTGSTYKVTVSGPPGVRILTVPASWGAPTGWTKSGNTYTLNYTRDEALTSQGAR